MKDINENFHCLHIKLKYFQCINILVNFILHMHLWINLRPKDSYTTFYLSITKKNSIP